MSNETREIKNDEIPEGYRVFEGSSGFEFIRDDENPESCDILDSFETAEQAIEAAKADYRIMGTAMELLYCPECGAYLMAGDGRCHDCSCGWKQDNEKEV